MGCKFCSKSIYQSPSTLRHVQPNLEITTDLQTENQGELGFLKTVLSLCVCGALFASRAVGGAVSFPLTLSRRHPFRFREATEPKPQQLQTEFVISYKTVGAVDGKS